MDDSIINYSLLYYIRAGIFTRLECFPVIKVVDCMCYSSNDKGSQYVMKLIM